MSATLTAQAVQEGKGKGRDPWMIRRYLAMLTPPVTTADIARELNVTNSAMSRVLRGVSNSSRILGALEDMGCPAEYLYGERARGGKAA